MIAIDIDKLNKELQDSLDTFVEESHIHTNNKNGEKLDESDYEEMARQTFYVLDDYRKAILKYMKETK